MSFTYKYLPVILMLALLYSCDSPERVKQHVLQSTNDSIKKYMLQIKGLPFLIFRYLKWGTQLS